MPAYSVTYINHFVSQFAGEIGAVSLGLGKDFKRYSLSGMYGLVPPEMSQGPLIETVALRQTYMFYSWDKIDFYGGLNAFHVLSLQYQSTKFRDAPSDYYSIGSIRALLYGGVAIHMRPQTMRSFYFEAGLNDIWITNWISNSDSIDPSNHVSLAVGFKQRF